MHLARAGSAAKYLPPPDSGPPADAPGDEEKDARAQRWSTSKPSDTIQHLVEGEPPRPCSSQAVPGCADMSALGHFFAPQPRRSPAVHRKTERGRIEFGATILR